MMSGVIPSIKTDPSSGQMPEVLRNEARNLLCQLTIEEKAALCSGKSFWCLHGVERLGLPSIMVTDGPHGLRKQRNATDNVGIMDSVPAVCFPSAVNLASSWDRELVREVGDALGEECLQEEVSVLLGPGVNIKRSPLCGRNFEYFSEDPYLSGSLGTVYVQGVQGRGIGTSLKHYVANNQEAHRMVVDVLVDERTLREIYLPGFEATIKNAQPWTVMCSYSLLNGTYLSENKALLTDILKEEWGHNGLVVTDWAAANNRVQGIAAGLELDMPGNGNVFLPAILGAIESGELPEEVLNAAVLRIVELILRSKEALGSGHKYLEQSHHKLARRTAEESCVLLKNDGDFLPLNKSGGVAVIGAFATKPRYQGSGSSEITPTRVDNPLEEIRKLLPQGEQLNFAPGYRIEQDETDAALETDALELARIAGKVILFLGLPDTFESEAFDRTHMRLPQSQLRLVEQLVEINDQLVVVLQNGSPVELPFVDQVPAILEAYLGGQAGGGAIARVLFGEVCPSGKLAETFPQHMEDVPCHEWFPGEPRQVQYREGIWVGYRYYDTAGVKVAFPFGHGLSYTSFRYGELRVSGSHGARGSIDVSRLSDWQGLVVKCEIVNVGSRAGAEVVQLYVADRISSVHRPRRELRGFEKVFLEPGEQKTVCFELGSRAFAFWDTAGADWAVEAGEFDIEVGASSADIRLATALDVASDWQAPVGAKAIQAYYTPEEKAFDEQAFSSLLGHPIPAPAPLKPFHINSTLGEIRETFLGGLLFRQARKAMARIIGDNPSEKHLLILDAMIKETPLRSMVLMTPGEKFGFRQATVLIHLMNHRYGKALKAFTRGESA